MKRLLFSGLVAGWLALPGQAQDVTPQRPEGAQPPPDRPATLPPAAPEPGCGTVESCKTTYQLHWLEREVPGVVTRPVIKEEKTPDVRSTLELDYNLERQVRTEMVLKPVETVKEVTICSQKPQVVPDCNGCPTVIYTPFTETKLVKEITYCLVPQEKEVSVRTAFLKPVEQQIERRTLWLDWVTEAVTRKERFGVLVPVEITERKPSCPTPPPPSCPH